MTNADERRKLIRAIRHKTRSKEPVNLNCFVCGQHYYMTELHHLVPVAVVADMILATEKQITNIYIPTVYLCPNHHALWHLLQDVTRRSAAFEAFEHLTKHEEEKLKELDVMRENFIFEVQS